MKSEFIVDIISQKILLDDINAIRKKQLSELIAIKNIDVLEQSTEPGKSKLVTKQISRSSKKHIIILSMIASLSLVIIFMMDNSANFDPDMSLQSKYLIQNLRGDTTDTWVSWNIIPNRALTFTILEESNISEEKINAIKNAILSEKSLQIDNSILHEGSKGTFSTYYVGWQGAMQQASKSQTKMIIPQKFEYVESNNGVADITIKLDTQRNGDGYSGYTKSVVDENQILKSIITIYDVEKLSTEKIATITRHEFGHALGLAHSTAPESLMFPTITTDYPFISPCMLDAIKELYDGNQKSEVVCKI